MPNNQFLSYFKPFLTHSPIGRVFEFISFVQKLPSIIHSWSIIFVSDYFDTRFITRSNICQIWAEVRKYYIVHILPIDFIANLDNLNTFLTYWHCYVVPNQISSQICHSCFYLPSFHSFAMFFAHMYWCWHDVDNYLVRNYYIVHSRKISKMKKLDGFEPCGFQMSKRDVKP